MTASAIPPALRCPRTLPARTPDGYEPGFPAWATYPKEGVTQAPIGCFGVQWQSDGAAALESFAAMRALIDAPHVDIAACIDARGYETRMAIAYWPDRTAFDRWAAGAEGWWQDPARESAGHGLFREILLPRVDRLEALFSAPDRLEGCPVATATLHPEPVLEHGYWGGMRDRIAASQTDALLPSGALAVEARGVRTRIRGSENIAVIRSGQDWSDTTGAERVAYLDTIEPTLRAGMAYLAGDEGRAIGCHANRYMRHIDAAGAPIDKSFGMSLWRSLAELERWAESHATHLAIFNTFLREAAALDFRLQLRLYHEVMVLASDEQHYEYIGCHAETGMLAATARA